MSAGRGRRTGLILIVLILIVLVIGVGAIFFLQGVLGNNGSIADAPQQDVEPPTPTPPPTIDIIVAARDIPRGAQLTANDVTILRWPILAEAQPPIDVLVVDDNAGLDQVDDRIARVDIISGQPILDFMLTPGDQPTGIGDAGSDVSLLIPSGSVMMTIPIDRLSAAGYSLREGDHVDILMSFQFVDVDEEFQSLLPNDALLLTDDPELVAVGLSGLQYANGRQEDGPFGSTLIIMPSAQSGGQIARQVTQLVIDNAMVMEVGTFDLTDIYEPIVITPAPPPTPDPAAGETEEVQPTPLPVIVEPDIISLALSRQDALVLKYAIEQGADITLALRSALDNNVEEVSTDPVTLEYVIQFYDVQVPTSLPQALVPGDFSLNSVVDQVFNGGESGGTEN